MMSGWDAWEARWDAYEETCGGPQWYTKRPPHDRVWAYDPHYDQARWTEEQRLNTDIRDVFAALLRSGLDTTIKYGKKRHHPFLAWRRTVAPSDDWTAPLSPEGLESYYTRDDREIRRRDDLIAIMSDRTFPRGASFGRVCTCGHLETRHIPPPDALEPVALGMLPMLTDTYLGSACFGVGKTRRAGVSIVDHRERMVVFDSTFARICPCPGFDPAVRFSYPSTVVKGANTRRSVPLWATHAFYPIATTDGDFFTPIGNPDARARRRNTTSDLHPFVSFYGDKSAAAITHWYTDAFNRLTKQECWVATSSLFSDYFGADSRHLCSPPGPNQWTLGWDDFGRTVPVCMAHYFWAVYEATVRTQLNMNYPLPLLRPR